MKSDVKISVEELIRLLLDRPLGLHIEQLEKVLWKARRTELPVPKNLRAAIYGKLSMYTSQSMAFRQKRKAYKDDLFFSPGGKGSGVWAVHRERAEAWLNGRIHRLQTRKSEPDNTSLRSGSFKRTVPQADPPIS